MIVQDLINVTSDLTDVRVCQMTELFMCKKCVYFGCISKLPEEYKCSTVYGLVPFGIDKLEIII